MLRPSPLDHPRQLDKRRLTPHVGELSAADFRTIEERVRRVLDL
jgi:mRNA-degrading endonuclease toxin of MazEF toxin-antitoxin module